MGHLQSRTPIKTNNFASDSVVMNNTHPRKKVNGPEFPLDEALRLTRALQVLLENRKNNLSD